MAVQETSRTAYYHEIKPTLGTRQREVLREIGKHLNVTNTELSDELKWPINTVTPRTLELVKFGLVIEDCKRACRITGRRVIAWTVKRDTLF